MARYVVVVLLNVGMMTGTALLAGACGGQQVGELQRQSQSVDVQEARSVRTDLEIGAGELNLTGGSDRLMEADFAYNVADWEPKVNYEVRGEMGELSVKQGQGNGPTITGNARNEWDVRLNDEVPTAVSVQMGAGASDLDLDSLTLTRLDLEMGAGRTTIDLTGAYDRDLVASIQGGVGRATVLLPSEVGVRVEAQGGLGQINAEGLQKEGEAYVNDAYGDSEVTLDVDIQGGVGQINLEVVVPPAAASSSGPSWCIVPSPTLFEAPRAIAPVASDDIWLVGSRRDNTILSTGAAHWDGNGWTIISTPNRTTGGYSENVLNGVDALASNNVWAVGYSGVGGRYKTLIERWDGSRWRIVQSPNVGASSNTLTGVDAIARNQVWAVGYRRHGTHRETLVLRWNGSSWLAVTSPNPGTASNALLDVAAVSGNNVWAIGYKRDGAGHRSLLLRYDGTSWKQVAVPALGDGDNVLTSVSATSGNNVWVAGYYIDGTQYRPLTLHYDGNAWETLLRDDQGGSVSPALDIYASSASDVWTVGFRYRLAQNDFAASSWHWDGSTSTAFSNAVAQSDTKSEMLAVTKAPGLPQQVWAAGQPANVETICPDGNTPALSPTQESVGARTDEPVRASRATSSASAEASVSAAATAPAESTAPLATGLGVEAVNKAEEAGLYEFTRTYGAVVTDFDNDGLEDIFLGRHGSAPRLYLNNGNGHFSESNEGAWNQRDRHGCDAAYVNQDGLKDIYCAVGALHGSGTKLNELYIQQPNNTFVDRGAQYGVSEPFGRGRSATFVNADNDTFPDLFVVNETDRGDGLPSPNRLFTNQGGSAFKYNPERGLEFEGDGGAAYEVDFNKDGWQDLFVNMASSSRVAAPLRVYRNDRGERFINVAGQVGLGHSVSDVTVADLNGDQWADVIEVMPDELRVLLNEQGKFSLAFSTPLQYGVSVAAGDINGDGRQDLYVLRGEDSTGENAPDQVYVNAGNGENFSPMSSIPYTKEGEAESVWPIDYDRNGLTDFLVLNGAGNRSNLGPVQLIAFFQTS